MHVALHLEVIDLESDAQEQHEGCGGFFYLKDAFPVPAKDYRQGHRQTPLKQVGNCRHPAIQDDVANLLVSGKINSARPTTPQRNPDGPRPGFGC
jgi:hypothetical protein